MAASLISGPLDADSVAPHLTDPSTSLSECGVSLSSPLPPFLHSEGAGLLDSPCFTRGLECEDISSLPCKDIASSAYENISSPMYEEAFLLENSSTPGPSNAGPSAPHFPESSTPLSDYGGILCFPFPPVFPSEVVRLLDSPYFTPEPEYEDVTTSFPCQDMTSPAYTNISSRTCEEVSSKENSSFPGPSNAESSAPHFPESSTPLSDCGDILSFPFPPLFQGEGAGWLDSRCFTSEPEREDMTSLACEDMSSTPCAESSSIASSSVPGTSDAESSPHFPTPHFPAPHFPESYKPLSDNGDILPFPFPPVFPSEGADLLDSPCFTPEPQYTNIWPPAHDEASMATMSISGQLNAHTSMPHFTDPSTLLSECDDTLSSSLAAFSSEHAELVDSALFTTPESVKISSPACEAISPLPTVPTLMSRLRSNDIPLHAERKTLHHILADASTDLARYNEEIAELQETLSRTQKELSRKQREREDLQNRMEGTSSLLAPIRKLPIELIREIIDIVHPDGAFPSKTVAALTMRLCKHWTNVMFSMENLWGFVEASAPSSIAKAEADFQRVRGYINRGGNTPISMLINQEQPGFSKDAAMWNVIADCSHRWKYLRVDMPDSIPQTICEKIKGHLPQLEHLSIGFDFFLDRENPVSISPEWRTNMFAIAPKLNTVQISGPFDCSNFIIPWEQVLDFTANLFTLEQMLEFLRLCPKVQTVCLSYPKPSFDLFPGLAQLPGFAQNSSIVFSSALTSLRQAFGGPALTPLVNNLNRDFFRSVTLPALQAIDISYPKVFNCDPEDPGWPQQEFLSMLARSGCHLTIFRLHDVFISDFELLEIFRLMPSIEVLDLSEYVYGIRQWERPTDRIHFITERLLENLIRESSLDDCVPSLLPHMKSFILEFGALVEVDELFMRVVESRMNKAGTKDTKLTNIETIGFIVSRQSHEYYAILQKLLNFEDAGLTVRIDRSYLYGPSESVREACDRVYRQINKIPTDLSYYVYCLHGGVEELKRIYRSQIRVLQSPYSDSPPSESEDQL